MSIQETPGTISRRSLLKAAGALVVMSAAVPVALRTSIAEAEAVGLPFPTPDLTDLATWLTVPAEGNITWRTGHVAFSAWSPFVRIEGEMSCAPEQLVATPYEDPDGTHVWCHNTEIGDARVTIHRRGPRGWKDPRVLVSRGRAHFETGGRERDPAVVREHLLV